MKSRAWKLEVGSGAARSGLACGLVLAGFVLLTGGLAASAIYLKQTGRSLLTADSVALYCAFTWLLYLGLLVGRWRFAQRGRRLAWGAVATFVFVILTFWGVYLLSGLHQPTQHAAALSASR